MPGIKCKADLMKYCLETTARRTKKGDFICFNLDKAKKVFEFFTANVNLPDVEAQTGDSLAGALAAFVEGKNKGSTVY